MIHFALMLVFAAIVAVVFGTISKDNLHDRIKYSLRVFLEFVLVGLLLAWVFYFLPL